MAGLGHQDSSREGRSQMLALAAIRVAGQGRLGVGSGARGRFQVKEELAGQGS